MPIDYSQPGYKEMFANYGLTALSAQALEKIVLLLLAGIECLEAGRVEKNELYKVLDKNDRKTLGQLIKVARTKVEFPQELEDNLNLALKKRNYLMHNFFLNGFDVCRIKGVPDKLSEELLPIRDLFDSVQNKVDEIIDVIQKQLEVPRVKRNDKAGKLLKIYKDF